MGPLKEVLGRNCLVY